jgi:TonB family protein
MSSVLHLRLPLVAGAAALSAFWSTPARAQPPIEALLQRPLSVGVVGLLGAEPKAEGVEAALQNALRSEDPHIRAAAARMLSANPGGSAGVLQLTLERETDIEAAIEESFALLAGTDGAGFQPVIDAARRLALDSPSPFVNAVARYRKASFEARLVAVRSLSPNNAVLRDFVSIASGRIPALLEALTREAFGRKDTSFTVAALEVWQDLKEPLPQQLAELGIANEAPVVRSSACWATLAASLHGTPVAELTIPPADLDAGTDAGRFGCELVRRAGGEAPKDMTSLIDALVMAGNQIHIPYGADNIIRRLPASLLSATERSALGQRFMGKADRLAPTPAAASAPPPQPQSSVRLMGGYPTGFVNAIIQAAECRANGSSRFAAGAVEYLDTGSAQKLSTIDTGESAACVAAMRALLVASRLPDRHVLTSTPLLTILPLKRGVLDCLSAPRRFVKTLDGPRPIGETVKPPTKIRDVRPQYPASAQQSAQQGTVVAEAVISEDGCVIEAEVTRSVATSLDVEAILAVSQWQFTSTLLDGRPVPVIMTVSVNFKLQ